MRACIQGVGQWLPENIRTNDAWPPEFVAAAARRGSDRTLVQIPTGNTGDLCDEVTARHAAREVDDPFLGSTRRRVADIDISARQAEALAAEAALADADIDSRDVGLVISWSLVPDHITPPSAPWVAHAIGAKGAFAIGVDVACASALAQMEFAAAMIESGRIKYAVLTQSHLATRTFEMMHPASPGFGDAATAIVMGPGPGHELIGSYAVSEGQYYDAILWTRGTDDDRPWYTTGNPLQCGTRNSSAARQLIQNGIRFGAQTIGALMDELNMSTSAITALISVQPRRWFPEAIAETLGLAEGIAPQTFDELAHLGAAGTVTNLIAARERGLLQENTLVAFYAQGAGFTRAAALVRW
jgi:3-oxoacyl-[acyl-carrier-protein] synthase-3